MLSGPLLLKADVLDSGRRGYHHGRLKEALLEAARCLVVERGINGFSLGDAAKLVGVTAAAPYRHYPDTNALVAELGQRRVFAAGTVAVELGHDGLGCKIRLQSVAGTGCTRHCCLKC